MSVLGSQVFGPALMDSCEKDIIVTLTLQRCKKLDRVDPADNRAPKGAPKQWWFEPGLSGSKTTLLWKDKFELICHESL